MDNVICLCYSSEKGFYTKYSSSPCGEDNVIFRSYEKNGYKDCKITIPNAQVEIKIFTNFGYGSVSYLFARISKKGIPIFDFSPKKLFILNHAGIQDIVAKPGDWYDLFVQIINAISNFQTETYYTSAKTYMEELCKMAQMQSLDIRGHLHDKKSTKWEGDLLVMCQMSRCIKNFLSQLMIAKIEREDLTKECMALCQQYLETMAIKYPSFDHSDTRMTQIEETLYVVHQYLYELKVSRLFLETMLASHRNTIVQNPAL